MVVAATRSGITPAPEEGRGANPIQPVPSASRWAMFVSSRLSRENSPCRMSETLNCAIKLLGCDDDLILQNAAADVFRQPDQCCRTREFLEDSRHHLGVAIDDKLVVGFASAVHYIHPDKLPELWINEVAVALTHRGLGLGRGMAGALFELGKARYMHL